MVTVGVVGMLMIAVGFYAWSMLFPPGVVTDPATLGGAPEPDSAAPIVVPEPIPAGESEPPARSYRWRSGKVIVADVDGDGIDDVIGMITEGNQQIVRRVAISGSDGEFIWESEVGTAANVPAAHLSFDAEHRLVLMTVGTEISAFELATGERRWASHASDKIEAEILDGERLFVATADDRITGLQITDGTSLASDLQPSDAARNLPKDWTTTQTPLPFRYTDTFEFAGLEVATDFCPIDALPWVATKRMRPEHLRCDRSRGLALAHRAEGTEVPYWVGFSHADKAESWRAQATTPGSLETLARIRSYDAELSDEFAIVWVTGSENPNLAAVRRLSLVDGEVAWSYTIESKWVRGVTIGSGQVFVTEGDRVHVLDLETGARLRVLGEALP